VLYFDEQMSNRPALLLRQAAIDVTTVDWLGHKGQSDAVQLLQATRLGRAIVTYNVKDLMLLHDAWLAWSEAWPIEAPQRHAGILGIRSAKNLTDGDIARLILELVQSAVLVSNRMFRWDRRAGWQEYRERTMHSLGLPHESSDDSR
jgi:hypothetical protein